MLKRPPIFIALLALTTSTLGGCYRYQTQVPGIIDLRSDGSAASTAPPKVRPETTRAGLNSLFLGKGAQPVGSRVTVSDRHFFIGLPCAPGAYLFSNQSAADELRAATDGQALRYVRVGHQFNVEDYVAGFLVSFIPCSSCAVPTSNTFTASGERIVVRNNAARLPPPIEEPPPPPSNVAPPPPSASDDDDKLSDEAPDAIGEAVSKGGAS